MLKVNTSQQVCVKRQQFLLIWPQNQTELLKALYNGFVLTVSVMFFTRRHMSEDNEVLEKHVTHPFCDKPPWLCCDEAARGVRTCPCKTSSVLFAGMRLRSQREEIMTRVYISELLKLLSVLLWRFYGSKSVQMRELMLYTARYSYLNNHILHDLDEIDLAHSSFESALVGACG